MQGTMDLFFRIVDVLVVIGGFSLIIVLHELGHFLAARWAGIRVLAFAVGFGPAIVSYRRGLGLRRGSGPDPHGRLPAGEPAGTTEYRINALPFGGYVKMLGQDDADPSARSDQPDSFQSTPVWKRMIVISAGVAMNLLLAAVLFVVVFMIGLRTEPPSVGDVQPDSPAATAVARNAAALGIAEPGLQPGDTIVSVDGKKPSSFIDIMNATVMARGGKSLELRVERHDLAQPLIFEVVPRADPESNMLQLGIRPEISVRLDTKSLSGQPRAFRRIADRWGLIGVTPDMHVARVNGQPARTMTDVARAAGRSGDEPIRLEFVGEGGRSVELSLHPRPDLQATPVEGLPGGFTHLLGLAPVMQVEGLADRSTATSLRTGDVFVQVGRIEWPNIAEGRAEIHRNRSGTVRIAVARLADGAWRLHELGELSVAGNGTLGIYLRDGPDLATWVTGWPDKAPHPAGPALMPGSRLAAVDGQPTTNFGDLRRALRRATAPAASSGSGCTVDLLVELPVSLKEGTVRAEHVSWMISAEEVRAVHGLGWGTPLPIEVFKPEKILLKAAGPLDAIEMGLDRTRSAMLSTYITFARLFQGTIKVEQLKGPVGITHLGTIIASKGFVWLMFFLALVSVNLAVINFLPLPIVDGGLFLFLVYEQVRGKPPSPGVQNAAAAVGLVLIVGLLLFVTFHDIKNLFG